MACPSSSCTTFIAAPRITRCDGRRVICIPSSPDPRAGSVMMMDADRVEPVPMTFLATLRSMRALGRGLGPSLPARPQPQPEKGQPT